jgi:hypothetical protein
MLYVLPMEKHELYLATGTYIMYCNVLLQDGTRHTSVSWKVFRRLLDDDVRRDLM